MSRRFLPAVFACALGTGLCAQGIEGVLVERYSEQPGAAPGAPPLVTYRIFLDLAPGHALVSVFGEKGRNLFFQTSTRFFNDTLHGADFGSKVDDAALKQHPVALDSWLACGFASDAHKAVPLHMDTDGSVLRKSKAYGTELRTRDGLAPAATVPEPLNLYISTSFLHELGGNLIDTEVGAYGVRGTVKGATEENMVLIAQLTTDGALSYGINVAVMAPDGAITKYLAYPAKADDERELPALLHRSAD